MSFLKFVENPDNSLWIDIGFLIFIFLGLVLIYFIRPFYFHYIGSLLLLCFGILVIFWPAFQQKLNTWYETILLTKLPGEIREFLLYLKFNVLVHQMFVFAIVLFGFFVLATLNYYLVFKRLFGKYYDVSGRKIFALNFTTKLLSFFAFLVLTAFFATPFYLLSTKNNGKMTKLDQSRSYLNSIFNTLKIPKYTNSRNNPLQPIWQDLEKLQKTAKIDEVTKAQFASSFKKVDNFFKTNFNYFYLHKWSKARVNQYFRIRDLQNENNWRLYLKTSDQLSDLRLGFQTLLQNYFNNYFLFLPKFK